MNQLASEFLKLRTARASRWTIIGLIAAMLLIAGLGTSTVDPAGADGVDARMIIGVTGGTLPALVMVILGILAVAGEFHHKTIIGTYLVAPRRNHVLVAKLAALAGLGAAVGGVCAIGTLALGLPILHQRGIPVDVSGLSGALGQALACVLLCAFGATLGVALGFCFRSPIAGIVAFVGWITFGESLLRIAVPEGLLPKGAMQIAATGAGPLAGWLSLLVLAGYSAAAVLLASGRFLARDVTA